MSKPEDIKFEHVHKLITTLGSDSKDFSLFSISNLFYRPSISTEIRLDDFFSAKTFKEPHTWTYKRKDRVKPSGSATALQTPSILSVTTPTPTSNTKDIISLSEWDHGQQEMYEALLIKQLRAKLPKNNPIRALGSLEIASTVDLVQVFTPHIPQTPRARNLRHMKKEQRSSSSPHFRKIERKVDTERKEQRFHDPRSPLQLYPQISWEYDSMNLKKLRKGDWGNTLQYHEQVIHFLEKKHPLHDLYSSTFDGSGITLMILYFYLRSKSYFLALRTLSELHQIQPTHMLFGPHGGHLLGIQEERKASSRATSSAPPDTTTGDAVEALFHALDVTKEGLPDELLSVPYIHLRLMEYLERFYKQGKCFRNATYSFRH